MLLACAGAPEPSAAALPPLRLDPLPPLLRPADARLLEDARFRTALSRWQEGDPVAAAVQLELLEHALPAHAELQCVHAWALLAMGDPAGAIRSAQDLASLAAAPGAPLQARARAAGQAAYVLGMALAAQQRWREADPWLQAALQSGAEDAAVLGAAAQAALAAGDGARALECARALDLRAPGPATERLLAGSLLAAGRPADAEQQYRHLLQQAPDDPELRESAGLAAFAAGAYARAAQDFAAAAARQPMSARHRFQQGCALDWGGEPSAAETAYRAALELDPGCLDAAENLATLLAERQRLPEALQVLREQLRQPLGAAEVQRLAARQRALEAGGGPLPARNPPRPLP